MPKKRRKSNSLSKKVESLSKKISRIDTTIERKYIDIATRGSLSLAIPFPAYLHNCVDLAAQGTEVNERIGNKITMRQVQIRSTLVMPENAAYPALIRAVVVQWVNNQDTPVPADINYVLDYDAPTSTLTSMNAMNCPYLINSDKKYRVLHDSIIRLNGGAGGLASVKLLKKYFTLKGKNQIATFEDITPVRDDPSNNQVSLFLIPGYPVPIPSASPGPSFFTESRLYYQDA